MLCSFKPRLIVLSTSRLCGMPRKYIRLTPCFDVLELVFTVYPFMYYKI